MASRDSGGRPRTWPCSYLRVPAPSRSSDAHSSFASRRSAPRQPAGRIIGIDRADHEDDCTARDHRERDPVDLAVQREADQLDRMRERIGLAEIIEIRAALL